ncbi:MAG TPA: cytochrome c oxidase subunit II [Verrucomicrobiae bacterium]|nr:cytochrome c oxidase subunit II [Verrucomicrobiae bacterium]
MSKYYGWGLPFNASANGAAIDRLIYGIHGIMFVLFIGWLTFLVYTLIRFRARPGHQAAYKVHHFKAPTYLEVSVALIEVLLLVGFSFPIMNHVKNQFPNEAGALKIHVVAEQFAWNIHYPGADGVFGKTRQDLMGSDNPVGLDPSDPHAADDIVTINQLHIPVNKPIIINLTSKDVIHSFFLPVMRVKQDAIPGDLIPLWMEANKTGDFEIACAQLCGLGHYRMRGFFSIHTQEDFDKWLKDNAPAPAAAPVAPAV